MTRPGNQPKSRTQPPVQHGGKVPDQPRDCGPHVDDWPILDTQMSDSPKPKADEYGTPAAR
jgi:hypothetical protein